MSSVKTKVKSVLTTLGTDSKSARATLSETDSLEQLQKYALTTLGDYTMLGKKSCVALFRAGKALASVKERMVYGDWSKWLKDNKIAHSTSYEAMTLAKRAGSEEQAGKYTITEAKRKWLTGKRKSGKRVKSAKSYTTKITKDIDALEIALTKHKDKTPAVMVDLKSIYNRLEALIKKYTG